jgi:multiple sugar transport system substrate-binding protein
MVDMITKHKITPETAVSYDQEEVFQDFTAGKYGMISGAAVRVPTLRREAKAFDPLSIQLIFWPGWSGGDYARGLFSGWAVGVWSKSKVMEEAADFLQFMMNEESDKLWVLDGGQVPVRKSTITALGSFFADPENEYLKKMAEGFAKYCWVTPTDVTISGWREDLNKAAQDVVVNGTDPLEALKKVAKDFNDRNM